MALQPFPQTVPGQSIVGRLSAQSGPTEAIPLSTLANLLQSLFAPGSTLSALSLASNGMSPFYSDDRLSNSWNRIDQRNKGAAQTITQGAAAAYTIDRWYASCTGANVTGQQLVGSGQTPFVYQFTGAAGNTGVTRGQKIEAQDIWDCNNGYVTLMTEQATSGSLAVTWTAYYATATDNWASRTQIATGVINTTSILTAYPVQFQVPIATQQGLSIEFSVAALGTSATWTHGRSALKRSAITNPAFDWKNYGDVLRQCQRYLPAYNATAATQFIGPAYLTGTTGGATLYPLKVTPRVPPTGMTTSAASGFSASFGGGGAALTGITFGDSSYDVVWFTWTLAAGGTNGYGGALYSVSTTAQILFTGCEL